MKPVETIPGMGEKDVEENNGGVNSTMTYLIYITATMYTQNKKKKKNKN
jgi:hypothetical protein